MTVPDTPVALVDELTRHRRAQMDQLRKRVRDIELRALAAGVDPVAAREAATAALAKAEEAARAADELAPDDVS